jgi:hypothetical protein
MQLLKLSEGTAARRRIPVYLVDATDGITEETGLTPTVTVSKNGAAFAAAGGTTTEVANGLYYYQATAGELDTPGFLVVRVANAASRTFVAVALVVAYDPHDAAGLGLSRIDVASSTLATAAAATAIEADTQDIQSRLPAALVGGRIDASVGAVAAGAITAASIATGAIDADAIAADAVTELQSGLATAAALTTLQTTATAIEADTQDIQSRLPAALVSGRIDASVGAVAAGAITAAAIATGAIDADAIAADAVTEIQAGLATAVAVAAVQADTDALQLDTATIIAGVAAVNADTDNIQTRIPAALVGGRMDASVGAMAANVLTAAATAADFGTEVATAVDTTLTASHDAGSWGGGGGGGATAAEVADAVWDEARADHSTAGTFGQGVVVSSIAASAITAAAIAADAVTAIAAGVWARVLEGAHTAADLVRLVAAVATGNASGLESGSVTYRDLANSKNRVVGTVASGARTVTTRDGT